MIPERSASATPSTIAIRSTGSKTATSCLLVEHELDGVPLPVAGERQSVVDSTGPVVAAIEIVAVDVLALGDVGLPVAIAEGEGFRDVAHWRAEHERFWRDEVLPRLPAGSLDALDEKTAVVVEWFRVVAVGQRGVPKAVTVECTVTVECM